MRGRGGKREEAGSSSGGHADRETRHFLSAPQPGPFAKLFIPFVFLVEHRHRHPVGSGEPGEEAGTAVARALGLF